MKRIIVLIGILLICMNCNNPQHKNQDMKKDNQKETIANADVLAWLEGLNRAMQAGGDLDHNPNDLASKGEPTSKFTELKRRIEEKGYQLKWDGQKYILISPEKS